jgi:hypothetical protein
MMRAITLYLAVFLGAFGTAGAIADVWALHHLRGSVIKEDYQCESHPVPRPSHSCACFDPDNVP